MLETDRDLKGLNDSGLSSVGQNNSLEPISLSSQQQLCSASVAQAEAEAEAS